MYLLFLFPYLWWAASEMVCSDAHPLVFMPLVIISLWVWAGLSDSLLMNRGQQKWWDTTSKIRLQKDGGFLSKRSQLHLYGEVHVIRKWHLQATVSEDPRLAKRHMSDLENRSPAKPWNDHSPGQHLNCSQYKLWESWYPVKQSQIPGPQKLLDNRYVLIKVA